MAVLRVLQKYRNEYLASIAATLSLFMVVTTTGWASPALAKLTAEDSPIPITPTQGSWFVALESVGAFLGPLLAAYCADRIGRKWTLMATFAPVTVGWILVGTGDSFGYLYASRTLFGLSYGIAYSTVSVYLNEVASDSVRGSIGTLNSILGRLGHLTIYGVGPYLEFRTMAWVFLVAPFVFVGCFVWMPDTPYFHLGRNNNSKAESSLRWLRREKEVSKELAVMQASLDFSKSQTGSFRELFSAPYRKQMSILIILITAAELSGISVVRSYAQKIFENIAIDLKPEEMSILLGVVQLLTALVPMFLVERMGRRPLLLISTVGTCIGTLLCALYFAFDANGESKALGYVAFIAFLLIFITYGLGLSSISLSILGEIFPKHLRAYSNATFIMMGAILTFSVTRLFQVMVDSVGTYLPFAMYTVCQAINTVLIYFNVLETKGKSFGEIQRMFDAARKEKSEKGEVKGEC
ncbi:facilitated trehalose transporter Tret1-like [Uranotaenia lowii]|uniref:facilitated trehalose transporter Tret1-like n=1 Tax=Uranotaenia lowii TaxID=190385 RepID=UPI0024791DD8|nr:facilitated trehalose transporter Tret1-like [Uranotaenia lowii]